MNSGDTSESGSGPRSCAPPADDAGRRGPHRLTEEQRQLAADYRPFALNLAKPYKRLLPNLTESLESAALLGLTQAAGQFDPERGVKFATFSRRRICGAILDELRGQYPRGYPDGPPEDGSMPVVGQLFDQVFYASHGRHRDSVHPPDSHPGPEELAESAEGFALLGRSLSGRHAELVRLIYAEGKSQAEAAEVLGVSKSRLSYLHAEALAILREAVTNDPARYHVDPDRFRKSEKGDPC
jgi:RNA polymerase sigma factor for flagellar operon FliA